MHVKYEGETPPTPTDGDLVAFEVWGYLHNGHGGIDWAGLDTVVASLGIADVEGLLHRLKTIKLHRPPVQQE